MFYDVLVLKSLYCYINKHASIETNEDIEVAYLSQLQGENLNESNTIF